MELNQSLFKLPNNKLTLFPSWWSDSMNEWLGLASSQYSEEFHKARNLTHIFKTAELVNLLLYPSTLCGYWPLLRNSINICWMMYIQSIKWWSFSKVIFRVIPYHSNPQNTDNTNNFAKLPSLLEECSVRVPSAKDTTQKQASFEKIHSHCKRHTEIIFVNCYHPQFLLQNNLCKIV